MKNCESKGLHQLSNYNKTDALDFRSAEDHFDGLSSNNEFYWLELVSDYKSETANQVFGLSHKICGSTCVRGIVLFTRLLTPLDLLVVIIVWCLVF